jgi:hypothetical protein
MVHTSVNSSSSFNKPFIAKVFTKNNLQPNALQKAVIAAIQNLGLQIEICGSWIWVFKANPLLYGIWKRYVKNIAVSRMILS